MARKTRVKRIPLYKCIEGHHLWCNAQNYSQNTINDYTNTFTYFTQFVGKNTIMDDITLTHVEQFMKQMKETPISSFKGVTKGHKSQTMRYRAPKTLLNYHTSLSSLWRWAVERGYARDDVLNRIKAPKVHQPPIQPLTSTQIKRLLAACEETREWHNKKGVTNFRPSAERDKAMIGVFTDTAIRCSELINIQMKHVTFHPRGGEIFIHQGKGKKSRVVPFQRKCASLLHAWLILRDVEPDDYLFVNVLRNRHLYMTRDVVYKTIKKLGKKCQPPIKVSPQILRVTAACMMLQNGMSAFELQRIMGHSNIQTTMRYVAAANVDLHAAMRKASPLDNIRL